MKKEHSMPNKLSHIYKPKGYNQKLYFDYLHDPKQKIIATVGPAGTGKTMLAVSVAVDLFKKKQYEKIIITRPVVSVEEDIGFLPGNLVKKMDPWTRPIMDIFMEYYCQAEITNMIQNNIIEISPLGYMRGRTFKNAFIIADEMQNSSPNQMLMLLTRIGINSKMVITGDLAQSDRLENNGLKDLIYKYKHYYLKNEAFEPQNSTITDNAQIKIVELNNTDIQRSEVVQKVLQLYNYKEFSVKEENVFPVEKKVYKKRNIEPLLLKHKMNTTITVHNVNSSDSDCALIPKPYVSKFYPKV
jgi:phosphate starvation-inducible PhoH-like protein